ncbi:MAG: hypothetical protein M5U19_10160 [Microthrixaceae bacterium]|nr:hypothetical protein [Microthrixaceae bacterium]
MNPTQRLPKSGGGILGALTGAGAGGAKGADDGGADGTAAGDTADGDDVDGGSSSDKDA